MAIALLSAAVFAAVSTPSNARGVQYCRNYAQRVAAHNDNLTPLAPVLLGAGAGAVAGAVIPGLGIAAASGALIGGGAGTAVSLSHHHHYTSYDEAYAECRASG
jgi:hypothetical protein